MINYREVEGHSLAESFGYSEEQFREVLDLSGDWQEFISDYFEKVAREQAKKIIENEGETDDLHSHMDAGKVTGKFCEIFDTQDKQNVMLIQMVMFFAQERYNAVSEVVMKNEVTKHFLSKMKDTFEDDASDEITEEDIT